MDQKDRALFLKRRRQKIAKIMARKKTEEDRLLNLAEFDGVSDAEELETETEVKTKTEN